MPSLLPHREFEMTLQDAPTLEFFETTVAMVRAAKRHSAELVQHGTITPAKRRAVMRGLIRAERLYRFGQHYRRNLKLNSERIGTQTKPGPLPKVVKAGEAFIKAMQRLGPEHQPEDGILYDHPDYKVVQELINRAVVFTRIVPTRAPERPANVGLHYFIWVMAQTADHAGMPLGTATDRQGRDAPSQFTRFCNVWLRKINPTLTLPGRQLYGDQLTLPSRQVYRDQLKLYLSRRNPDT